MKLQVTSALIIILAIILVVACSSKPVPDFPDGLSVGDHPVWSQPSEPDFDPCPTTKPNIK